eukprot:jgi/Mesen1/5812/ME000293S04959
MPPGSHCGYCCCCCSIPLAAGHYGGRAAGADKSGEVHSECTWRGDRRRRDSARGCSKGAEGGDGTCGAQLARNRLHLPAPRHLVAGGRLRGWRWRQVSRETAARVCRAAAGGAGASEPGCLDCAWLWLGRRRPCDRPVFPRTGYPCA